MTISSHEDLRDDHLFTAAVDALERQARQHTAGMAELARTIRVLLGASTAGLLKPEDDHYIRGLVEAYRMLLGLPDTKAAAVEAAQHAWAWAAAQQQEAGKEGTR